MKSNILKSAIIVGGLLICVVDGAEAQSNLPSCGIIFVNYDNCFGTYTYANGEKYVGEFKDSKRNGQGTFTSPDGAKYVGEYKDDKFYGQGTVTFPDGRKYVGEFKDNKRNGQGKEFFADGRISRQGYWIAGSYFGTNPPAGMRGPGAIKVKLELKGGVFTIPVFINDSLKLNFVLDSGASDVSMPADVVLTLMRTGTIEDKDFIEEQKYRIADGSVVTSKTFNIKSLRVGDKTVLNVAGSMSDTKGSLLLGQSFLSKFKSWSVDNETHELILE